MPASMHWSRMHGCRALQSQHTVDASLRVVMLVGKKQQGAGRVMLSVAAAADVESGKPYWTAMAHK